VKSGGSPRTMPYINGIELFVDGGPAEI